MDSEDKNKEPKNTYLERPWLNFYPQGLAPDVDIPNISIAQAFDEAVHKWKKRE